ncbi:MAG: hypothetical protein AMXMBFR58_06620 [Phycisphaerae bacterium]
MIGRGFSDAPCEPGRRLRWKLYLAIAAAVGIPIMAALLASAVARGAPLIPSVLFGGVMCWTLCFTILGVWRELLTTYVAESEQMGYCGHCGYSRGEPRTCPECGREPVNRGP